MEQIGLPDPESHVALTLTLEETTYWKCRAFVLGEGERSGRSQYW